MNIDQALAEIIAYSVAHSTDSLGAIEMMVKKYKTLTTEQRRPLKCLWRKQRNLHEKEPRYN